MGILAQVEGKNVCSFVNAKKMAISVLLKAPSPSASVGQLPRGSNLCLLQPSITHDSVETVETFTPG